MNLSVRDVGGGLLLVPQFTLVADTTKGMRPSFSSGASPEHGRTMFEYLAAQARAHHADVACGDAGKAEAGDAHACKEAAAAGVDLRTHGIPLL